MSTLKGQGYLSVLSKEFRKPGQKLGRRVSSSDDVLASPTGLYKSCKWEERAVRRLIVDGRIAPRWKGIEDEDDDKIYQECPICFHYYPYLNTCTCCNQSICTECYLQVKSPVNDSPCPFGCPSLSIAYFGPSCEEYGRRTSESSTGSENGMLSRESRSSHEEETIETISIQEKEKIEKEAARQAMIAEYERALERTQKGAFASLDSAHQFYPQVIEDMMLLEAIRNSLAEQSLESTAENKKGLSCAVEENGIPRLQGTTVHGTSPETTGRLPTTLRTA